MRLGRIHKRWLTAALAGAAWACFAVAGCSTSGGGGGGNESATTRPSGALDDSLGGRGRAQVWSQTCNRCHYAPSPDRFNGAQWEVVMRHMRVRASLTEAEHKAILEFLQASK